MPIIENPSLTQLSGPTIRIARAVRNISQRKLGLACGLNAWQVWAIENNVRKATPDELARLWSVLSTGPEAPSRTDKDDTA